MYNAFERIRKAAPTRAEAWLARLFAHIRTLEKMPRRCGIIPETEALGFEARHLLFSKRKGVYRIIFRVLENERKVEVLRLWHGSRQALSAEDVE